jgi:tetratricopeptide (TPR) repeat protein
VNPRKFLPSALICLALVTVAVAEDQPKSNPKRDRAFELYRQGKMVNAMPLFEELSVDNPKDVAVIESWGASVLGYAQTLSDVELRKKARVRARSILLKAQALGDNSDLLQTLLRDLPEDGSFSTFSDKKDVDQAMQQAEADFARGDLEKARQGYMRAHLLDPKQYYAALFIGDTYFKQHQLAFAGEWFSQAGTINPNIETAYRYWGDALLDEGKLDEARSKYIDAIVADPYNANSWNGLKNWLGRTKLTANWLKLKDGVEVEIKAGGNTNVNVDSSLPGGLSAAWLMYGMNRSLWMSEKFKKEFPKETAYRHSLLEETESLSMLLEGLKNANDTEDGKKLKKNDAHAGAFSDFEILANVHKAGFLEPFVLLNRADDGIAQDYPAYRDANRDKVRRYLDEFVVPKTPPRAEP